MTKRYFEDNEANDFIAKNLVRESVDSTGWQITYRDPKTGSLWLQDYPYSYMQGGGMTRLRMLPLDRKDLIAILVSVGHLNDSERQQLNSNSVFHSEVAAAISKEFSHSSWYPPDARPWPCNGKVHEGFVLEKMEGTQIRLWVSIPSQLAKQSSNVYDNPAQAIQAFISGEWVSGEIDGIHLIPD